MNKLITALMAVGLVGCTKAVPVDLEKLKVPAECQYKLPADLPPAPAIADASIGPDGVNKHWARHWRLRGRPSYRRLYRAYRVCSKYARSIGT